MKSFFGFVGLIILIISIGLVVFSADPLGKLDPVLRNILWQQQRALQQLSRPLNLANFAQAIEVIPAGEPQLAKIGVLIRTRKLSPLKNLGLQIGAVAGDVVTAKVTLEELTRLTKLPGVIYIEASKIVQPLGEEQFKLAPELDVSLAETGADQLHNVGLTGKDVVVGFVDTGIDCVHKDFRVERNATDLIEEETSRILFIWDQTTGREYTKADIESSITTGSMCPVSDAQEKAPSHGTHVIGIAGGDGSSSPPGFIKYIGLAPEAELIMVKSSYYFSDIIDGVSYIFQKAGSKPAVVNLSLGSHLGPHDGTSNFERALDNLLGGPGRIIVASAGNEGNKKIHVGAAVRPRSAISITFSVSPAKIDTSGQLQFDFWYDGDAEFRVAVITPNGTMIGPAASGQIINEMNTVSGGVMIDNASGGLNPNNQDKELLITLSGTSSGSLTNIASGRWTIRIEAGARGGRFDGWAQEVEFDSPNADSFYTVTMPATAHEVIAVGAYVTKESWQNITGNMSSFSGDAVDHIASFSSHGPTRDGRIKPDITAPGTAVASTLAEDARPFIATEFILPDNQHFINRGTSFAAPHVTGAAALLLQVNPHFTASEIKSILQGTAKSDSFTGHVPNNTWGSGKLSLQITPVWGKTIEEAIDANSNGVIEDEEILLAIEFWIDGQEVPDTSQVIDDAKILDLIELWVTGELIRNQAKRLVILR